MFEVELRDPHAQQELDAELVVLVARPQTQACERHRSEQEALREMRPLVWEFRFGANEQDVALKAGVAQTRCHGVAGGAAADDYCLRMSSRTRRSDQARYPPSTTMAKA